MSTVEVGDWVCAATGATGVVREVTESGVWIDCEDPDLWSDFGNPVAVSFFNL